VTLSVFPHDISKTDAARITKLDVQMFHDESGKRIYFGVKRSKVKVTSHKNGADVGLCNVVSAGFYCYHFIRLVDLRCSMKMALTFEGP